MRSHRLPAWLLLLCSTAHATSIENPANNYSCVSATHPNPVVLLHGLGATYYEDINEIQSQLNQQGFCTFSLTYGAQPSNPYVGGLQAINSSAVEIATLIHKLSASVAGGAGTTKIDIIGHSEGAFQSLYVPKFEAGVAALVRNIVAIAPPSHGTSFAHLEQIALLINNGSLSQQTLNQLGCEACNDLVDGGYAVTQLNEGPIVQSGNTLTVLISKDDELITPPENAFVYEAGVSNQYIQSTCPLDTAGHIGEAYDPNVWALILNALENTPGKEFTCIPFGSVPFR